MLEGSETVRLKALGGRASDCLILAVWFGFVTGVAELIVLAIRWFFFNRPIGNGPHVIWMAPLASIVLFAMPGVALFVTARLWPGLDTLRLATTVFSLLGYFNLLAMVPGLHHYASVVLAVGLALQTSRFIATRRERFDTFVRGSVAWVALRRRGHFLTDRSPEPMLSRRRVVIGAGAAIAGSALGVEAWQRIGGRLARAKLPPALHGRPNVLLIVLDTVRARNLSLYGYGRRTTPELELLSKSGVVFTRALSTAPWTLPSHASMFTGRFPHELTADWERPLDASYPTLAELLRGHGYLTGGLVANTGYTSYEHGLSRGFVDYEDYRISPGQLISSSTAARVIAYNFRFRRVLKNDEHLNRQPAGQITNHVLRWLEERDERPFFLFVNYYDAHEPYLPPPPFDRKFGTGRAHGKLSALHRSNWDPAEAHRPLTPQELREEIDAYDSALFYLDHHLGRLFDWLRRRRLLEHTLVIITSDHGEEFGEHRVYDHGNSLYLPSVHVPLIISLPSSVPAGTTLDAPVTLRDLPATVMNLLKLDENPRFPGASLARHWQGGAGDHAGAHALVSEVRRVRGRPEWFPVSKGDMTSLVSKGLRYIRNGDGREELYDFDRDPWEMRDLVGREEVRSKLMEFRTLLQSVNSGHSALG